MSTTALQQAAKDQAMRAITWVHRTAFDVTNGRVLGNLAGMPAVRLTTTGRRSGQTRTTMLTSPLTLPDGSVVLIASYGGDDRHPAWYLNLRANPEVEVVTGGRRFRALARTATDQEKSDLWPRVTAAYRGYAAYQRRTDRDIPVVVCTPTD